MKRLKEIRSIHLYIDNDFQNWISWKSNIFFNQLNWNHSLKVTGTEVQEMFLSCEASTKISTIYLFRCTKKKKKSWFSSKFWNFPRHQHFPSMTSESSLFPTVHRNYNIPVSATTKFSTSVNICLPIVQTYIKIGRFPHFLGTAKYSQHKTKKKNKKQNKNADCKIKKYELIMKITTWKCTWV